MRSSLLAVSLMVLSATALAADSKKGPSVPRPSEAYVDFKVTDFVTKPWMQEFEWVIVVNRATSGLDKQSVRIFHDQKLVTYEEVKTYLDNVTYQQQVAGVKPKEDANLIDRNERVVELSKKQWSPGVFKVSTGRNEFEAKGEHHSQHDSWSVTPTGFFTPQRFVKKHKSESYSSKLCESKLGKLISAFTRKQYCTYMENVTFFNNGIALHKAIPGTEPVLGSKASGGCVRLPAALSEYIYLNLQASEPQTTPLVGRDGSVQMDPKSGDILRTSVNKSGWGTLTNRGALIIVQDQVRNEEVMNEIPPGAEPFMLQIDPSSPPMQFLPAGF